MSEWMNEWMNGRIGGWVDLGVVLLCFCDRRWPDIVSNATTIIIIIIIIISWNFIPGKIISERSSHWPRGDHSRSSTDAGCLRWSSVINASWGWVDTPTVCVDRYPDYLGANSRDSFNDISVCPWRLWRDHCSCAETERGQFITTQDLLSGLLQVLESPWIFFQIFKAWKVLENRHGPW